ncbi:extensin family protein [Pacificimonas sp. WHA3]|uniref:Extensin family protein n=1 Tax=Pacificimonas pallii TaxID=2827236 RepID=A0ABS6SFS5_9SPHN|nr:extensin family protein [Pacificimonas pallii]MBV7257259.1 extensin family protein [Pacificimonas pallii]
MIVRIFVIFAVLCLAACGGGRSDAPVRSSSAAQAPRTDIPQSAKQCHARLDRLRGLEYRKLPPRRTAEGCGFSNGVQLLQVGVPISGITAMSCPVAEALHGWINEDLQRAARRHLGSDVVRIISYGTYSCRSVNSRPGARLSEHAYANAVDVAGFELADGRTIRVKGGWTGGGDAARFLKDVHGAACRRFQIVIGPDGDRFHEDHFHMDMGRGPYCR